MDTSHQYDAFPCAASPRLASKLAQLLKNTPAPEGQAEKIQNAQHATMATAAARRILHAGWRELSDLHTAEQRVGIVGRPVPVHLFARPHAAYLQPLLEKISMHFRGRTQDHGMPDTPLLQCLDTTQHAVCASPDTPARTEAVAALVGIRRGLFPGATTYRPSPLPAKAIP